MSRSTASQNRVVGLSSHWAALLGGAVSWQKQPNVSATSDGFSSGARKGGRQGQGCLRRDLPLDRGIPRVHPELPARPGRAGLKQFRPERSIRQPNQLAHAGLAVNGLPSETLKRGLKRTRCAVVCSSKTAGNRNEPFPGPSFHAIESPTPFKRDRVIVRKASSYFFGYIYIYIYIHNI